MIEQGRVYSTPNELHLPDTDGGYPHSDQIIQSSSQKPYQPVGVVPGLFNMEEGQQNICSNSQNHELKRHFRLKKVSSGFKTSLKI